MKNEKTRMGNPAKRYIVIDVETTGLSPYRGDRIIEIGAVEIEEGLIIAEFESLINCGKEIPRQAQEVHGITTEMLNGESSPEEALSSFMEFAAQSTLVAHNAKFDIGFLRSEFGRLGMGMHNRYVCTLQMSRRLYPQLPKHKPIMPTKRACSDILSERDAYWLRQDDDRHYYWEGEASDFSDTLDLSRIQTRTRHDQPLSRERWQFSQRQEHYFFHPGGE